MKRIAAIILILFLLPSCAATPADSTIANPLKYIENVLYEATWPYSTSILAINGLKKNEVMIMVDLNVSSVNYGKIVELSVNAAKKGLEKTGRKLDSLTVETQFDDETYISWRTENFKRGWVDDTRNPEHELTDSFHASLKQVVEFYSASNEVFAEAERVSQEEASRAAIIKEQEKAEEQELEKRLAAFSVSNLLEVDPRITIYDYSLESKRVDIRFSVTINKYSGKKDPYIFTRLLPEIIAITQEFMKKRNCSLTSFYMEYEYLDHLEPYEKLGWKTTDFEFGTLSLYKIYLSENPDSQQPCTLQEFLDFIVEHTMIEENE